MNIRAEKSLLYISPQILTLQRLKTLILPVSQPNKTISSLLYSFVLARLFKLLTPKQSLKKIGPALLLFIAILLVCSLAQDRAAGIGVGADLVKH